MVSVHRRLGRYAIQRRIGAGSFATVWLAYDAQLDSEVAIKVLAENWAADQHVRDRFVEEGRFLRRVDSPHVVPAYDAGELEDGRPFLVMAHADQGNLSERLRDQRLPGPQALTVIRHIGRGLTSLHVRGVLHRDVKPGNVLFRTAEDAQIRAMLGDLGLGKTLDGSSRLTMVAGTPAYVSPEQARGEALDVRSDLYSLAAIGYLLLSGRPAFDHASLTAAGAPRPPAPLGDDWPDEVSGVVLRGLEADRDRRTGSVPDFLAELDHACRGLFDEPTAQRLSSLPRDRSVEATVAGPRRSTRPVGWPATTEPSGPRTGAEEASPSSGRRRAGWLTVLASALVVALLAALAGFALQRRVPATTTVSSDDFSVTVPRGWDRVRGTEDWTPPGPVPAKPALVVGSARDWQTDTDESGAFIGVLPPVVTNDLVGSPPTFPEQLPGHPECSRPGSPDDTGIDGRRALTVISEGCPGVMAERAVRIDDVVLWIQVRGEERDQVEDVLASVTKR